MISSKSLFSFLGSLLMLMAMLAGGSYFYSEFIESPYLSFKEMPFSVPGPVYAGGPAVSHVVRCNSSSTTKTYTTTRGFQKMGANAPPVLLPSIDLTVEPGCEPAISRVNIVPDNTLPGWYRFVGTSSIKGLMVWHEVPWSTTFFEVIAKPLPESTDPATVKIPLGKEIKLEITP